MWFTLYIRHFLDFTITHPVCTTYLLHLLAAHPSPVAQAVKRGETYKNPYDLGPVKNWQEVFDETGRYWWITW